MCSGFFLNILNSIYIFDNKNVTTNTQKYINIKLNKYLKKISNIYLSPKIQAIIAPKTNTTIGINKKANWIKSGKNTKNQDILNNPASFNIKNMMVIVNNINLSPINIFLNLHNF